MIAETLDLQTIARAPTVHEHRVVRVFQWTTRCFAALIVLAVGLIVTLIAWQALPAIRTFGGHFVVTKSWDAGKGQFGILPEIVGTMLSSIIGVAAGGLFG